MRSSRLALAVVLAGALLFAGCGGDDDDSPEPTAGSTERPSAAATATEGDATVAATAPPSSGPTSPAGGDLLDEAAEAAKEALASWLGPAGNAAAIEVVSVEPRTWLNGCLEAARPGEACTEALVEGYRVLLGLGEAEYEVRTDGTGAVVRWAPSQQAEAKLIEANTNLILVETDDGATLAAQPVPGTYFGADLGDIEPGTPLAVAFAPAPQGQRLLLVWVVPAQ